MPGAQNHELGRRAVRDSDAGRAWAWVAATTSDHAQQRIRSTAATQPVGRRQSQQGLTREVKLARRVLGRCSPGTREDGSVSGPRERLECFLKQVNSPTTDAAVHSNHELGCNPVVSF